MIRPYEPTDADAMVAVWRASSDLAHPFLTRAFQDGEADNVRNVYTQFADIHVKEHNGEVIGFIALIENELGAIFLAPEFHGQGIGRELMDHAVALRGTLTLDVFEGNAIGRRFYASYGFKQVGEFVHGPTGQPTLKLAFDLAG